MKTDHRHPGYISRHQPSRWEEALLCGNGSIGALVMGDPVHESVIFSHEMTYLPVHAKYPTLNTAAHMDEIRAMIAAGRYQDAADFVVELGHKYGYTESMWTDCLIPLCAFFAEPELSGEVQDYTCGMNYENGLATVRYADDSRRFLRECFVSRENQTFFIRLSSDLPTDYRLGLETYVEDAPRMRWMEEYQDRLCEAEITEKNGTICYRRGFVIDGRSYEAYCSVLSTDGQITSGADHVLRVSGATEVVAVVTLGGTFDGHDSALDRHIALHRSLNPDFDEQLAVHTALHKTIYQRIRLQLGAQQLSDDALYQAAKSGNLTPQYYEKLFYAGLYEILSASGEYPPCLQGVWSGTYAPSWSGDYTLNGNVQTAVLSMLGAGMPELMESLFRYMDFIMEDMRANAQRLYGCRGIQLPARSSTHGLANHFSRTWPMTFWTTGAAWFARFYYDYWLYTCDDAFMLHRALPFMKDCIVFFEDFLIEEADGTYLFSPSYSPENHPANTGSQVCINSTMDIAVVRELLHNLIRACVTLGVEHENVEKWRKMLSKMPSYLINEDGALKEWATPLLEDRYDHRHASHLYPLYYGIAKEFADSPALLEACKKAYEIKIVNKKEEAGIMAFGSVQLGMAACHLGDTETVATLISGMAQNNYYTNFATSHDAGPDVFNSDLSGGMPALILECLAQSSEVVDEEERIVGYEIMLLPTLPDYLPEGRVEGLRLRGGFLLNMSWKDGKLTEYELLNPFRKEYRICDPKRY